MSTRSILALTRPDALPIILIARLAGTLDPATEPVLVAQHQLGQPGLQFGKGGWRRHTENRIASCDRTSLRICRSRQARVRSEERRVGKEREDGMRAHTCEK